MCFQVSIPAWLNPYKCKLRLNVFFFFLFPFAFFFTVVRLFASVSLSRFFIPPFLLLLFPFMHSKIVCFTQQSGTLFNTDTNSANDMMNSYRLYENIFVYPIKEFIERKTYCIFIFKFLFFPCEWKKKLKKNEKNWLSTQKVNLDFPILKRIQIVIRNHHGLKCKILSTNWQMQIDRSTYILYQR